jgi:hypothetical protein
MMLLYLLIESFKMLSDFHSVPRESRIVRNIDEKNWAGIQ